MREAMRVRVFRRVLSIVAVLIVAVVAGTLLGCSGQNSSQASSSETVS